MVTSICKKTYEISETSKGVTLRRINGEGSFVGFKRMDNTPEELVQWLKLFYAYKYA